jgi:dihydropteroate synthase
MIGEVLGITDPTARDAGTIACVVAGALRGASIFRVHNVHAVVQSLRVVYPMLGGIEA